MIDNNYAYNEILKEISIYQEKYLEKLEKKENELKKQFEDIEESKLLLNENEINLKINNYNKEFNEFSLLVDEFNFHYQNEIIILREKILKEIIIILEKYAIDESIDLIFIALLRYFLNGFSKSGMLVANTDSALPVP